MLFKRYHFILYFFVHIRFIYRRTSKWVETCCKSMVIILMTTKTIFRKHLIYDIAWKMIMTFMIILVSNSLNEINDCVGRSESVYFLFKQLKWKANRIRRIIDLVKSNLNNMTPVLKIATCTSNYNNPWLFFYFIQAIFSLSYNLQNVLMGWNLTFLSPLTKLVKQVL